MTFIDVSPELEDDVDYTVIAVDFAAPIEHVAPGGRPLPPTLTLESGQIRTALAADAPGGGFTALLLADRN